LASSFTSIQKERRGGKNGEKNGNNKLSTLYTLTSKQASEQQRRKKTRKLQNSSVTENWDFFSGSDGKQVSVSVSGIHNRSSTQKSAPKNENFVALRSSSSLVWTACQRLLDELRREQEEEQEAKAAIGSFSHTQHSAHVHIVASLV
jgi:hypothetical protein